MEKLWGGGVGSGERGAPCSPPFRVVHFTTSSFPWLLPRLLALCRSQKTGQLHCFLSKLAEAVAAGVVTLPDVPKLWLGRFQQQSHSVNSPPFLPWVGGSITGPLYYPLLTFQEAHRPETSQVSLSSKNLWVGRKHLRHAVISALNPIHGFLGISTLGIISCTSLSATLKNLI